MKYPDKARFGFFRGQAGFTLIEILFAVAILGAIGAGFLTALETNSRATRTLDEHIVAANLAAAHLEALKEAPYADNYDNVGENITIPFQYDVVMDVQFSSDGATFAPYTGSDNETLQKITVQVSREGRPVFSICTFRAKR